MKEQLQAIGIILGFVAVVVLGNLLYFSLLGALL